jgi:hypothetical protein
MFNDCCVEKLLLAEFEGLSMNNGVKWKVF